MLSLKLEPNLLNNKRVSICVTVISRPLNLEVTRDKIVRPNDRQFVRNLRKNIHTSIIEVGSKWLSSKAASRVKGLLFGVEIIRNALAPLGVLLRKSLR